jgi:hypothetical protein
MTLPSSLSTNRGPLGEIGSLRGVCPASGVDPESRSSRFIVSVDGTFPRTRLMPVITSSDDVPLSHLLFELPPLASVDAGVMPELFVKKLELCCLQFDFTVQEDSESPMERTRQMKRDTLIEIHK